MEVISRGVGKCIKIKKGFFSCEKVEILKNLDYCIKQGEIIAIMGPVSSGKSTMIKVLSGMESATTGKILIDNVCDNKKLREISEVISDFNDKKMMLNDSVYNNLVLCGRKLKIDDFDIEKKIVDLRNVLELDRVINKNVSQLDEIDRIKVSIALSMLKNPFVVYFDNALMSLDTITKNVILKLLKRINKEFKTTIVVASVDLMDIEKICKRVSFIQNGEVILDGDFEELKEKYWAEKIVNITFNKSFNVPKGDFEILEMSEYFLKIKISFNKCDFASLIKQFDVNTVVDINISSVPLVSL